MHMCMSRFIIRERDTFKGLKKTGTHPDRVCQPRFDIPRDAVSGIKVRDPASTYIGLILHTWTSNFSFYRAADGRQTAAMLQQGDEKEGERGSNGCAAISSLCFFTPCLSLPVKWFPHCTGCKDGQTGGILTSFVQLDITGLRVRKGGSGMGWHRGAVAPLCFRKMLLLVRSLHGERGVRS